MNPKVKLRAMGLSEERINELVSDNENYRTVEERNFISPPASIATFATSYNRESILAWATALSEGSIHYEGSLPVHFRESPLVPVWIIDPPQYAQRCLKTLVHARIMLETDSSGRWGPAFWQEAIDRNINALSALRNAMVVNT